MSDPERLFKSDQLDPTLRELVKSLREVAPEADTATKSWASMAVRVAALPTVVPAPRVSPGPIALSASKALFVKLALLAVSSAILGGGVFWLRSQRRALPSANPHVAAAFTPAHSVASSALPSEVAPLVALELPALMPEKPSPTLGPAATPLHKSRLEAEASLLAKVRRELRGGDPRAALTTLNQLQAAFPRGELAQERDVLTVEVLAANGNTAAAKRKAKAFIAQHPSSPHSVKLERFAEAPPQ